jgi:hypothetical protein
MAGLPLGAVKAHVRAAAEEIAMRFQINSITGYRPTGSVANSDHPKGLAIDVSTRTKGTMVAEWTVANAKRLSVTYVIWNRRIYDTRSGKGWAAYQGPSPHTDHVHISFYPGPGDGSAPVDTGASASSMDSPDGCIQALISMLKGG